jgi:propionate CoA-transferase
MSRTHGSRICSAEEAVKLIHDGQTIATGGFVGAGIPEALLSALEKRFLETSKPRNLTLVYAAGQGDGKNRGANHLAHKGLIKRVVGGHWGLAPRLGELAVEGSIEAYNFPQGVICQLFRDIAAGRPGCITHIGLDTFIDPQVKGGRLNDRTPPHLVQRVELDGKTWLWYKSFPIHIGFVRATAADQAGNLIMNREAVFGEMLPIAQAAHNCGGSVIAQVRKILDRPCHPQHVRVPGILVDRIVIADPHEHEQTFAEKYNPGYCTANPLHGSFAPFIGKRPSGARRIISQRACDEIQPGAIANLGIGLPEEIAKIAAERKLLDNFTLTVESGPIGGVPAGGLSFGASLYPQAVIDQPAQFDFYDGQGLDFAALGMAQVDREGNVNVSKYGDKLSGVGGFVNITQTARRVVFCGTFTAGGLEIEIDRGKVTIAREGRIRKFVKMVEQLSFSAKRALDREQDVLYVTERAVFRLHPQGLELIEVAPGIDLEKQVVSLMASRPIMRHINSMKKDCFI